MQQTEVDTQQPSRNGLTTREITYAIIGGIVALIVISAVWYITGQQETSLPTVGEVNRPAPAFVLPVLQGEDFRLEDYKGKVVLVNFWATWCEPCREETPALQAAYEDLHEQGLEIVGINLTNDEISQGKGEKEISAFVNQYGVTYPIALDTEGDVANAFRIYPIPTSYFIDREGNIRYVRVSTLTYDEVATLFKSLMQ